jgi:ribosomal protein S18 acetylase RimI-like enzyme
MTRVDSFQQLSSILKRYPPRETNFYLSPGQCRRLIEAGLLCFHETDGAVLIFEQRGEGLKLYFRATDFMSATLPEIIAPIGAYLTYKGDLAGTAEPWLLSQGFCLVHRLIHMTAQRIDAHSAHTVTDATEGEADRFFRALFPSMTGDLPLPGNYGILKAVRGADGAPLAMAHYDNSGEMLLCAVKPEARRKGYARSLYAALPADPEVSAGKYRLWAVETNAPALALYASMGFTPDGLMSNLYIKRST